MYTVTNPGPGNIFRAEKKKDSGLHSDGNPTSG
jgi:hypothetical protein